MGTRAALKKRSFIAKYGKGLVFLLPSILVFAIFQWYPIIKNFVIAFQEYVPGFPATWVGLDNFKSVIASPKIPIAIRNTVTYVLICLVIGYVVPIIVSIAISEVRKGRGFFRLAIYVPNIIPSIAIAIIWRWIFNPQFGLLNIFVGALGIPPQQWLLSKDQVLFSLALMSTWQNFGGTAVLYMASLTSVSGELYEAAELDGAGLFQRIRYVTLPAISGTMSLLLVLQLIATFQVMQEPFVLTAGGPNDASLTLMLKTYNYAFVDIEFGKAGALGSLLFLALLAFSVMYVKRSGLIEPKGDRS
jgi:multiple sugar transport system permease protein